MGWFLEEAPGCEGWLVAVEIDSNGRHRDFTPDSGEAPAETIQIACECGWRSPRRRAPSDTTVWDDGTVHLSKVHYLEEMRYRAIWREHVRPHERDHQAQIIDGLRRELSEAERLIQSLRDDLRRKLSRR